jgi:hypothetical protein
VQCQQYLAIEGCVVYYACHRLWRRCDLFRWAQGFSNKCTTLCTSQTLHMHHCSHYSVSYIHHPIKSATGYGHTRPVCTSLVDSKNHVKAWPAGMKFPVQSSIQFGSGVQADWANLRPRLLQVLQSCHFI